MESTIKAIRESKLQNQRNLKKLSCPEGDRLIYGVDSHPDSFTSGCSSLYLIDIKTASIVREFNSDRFFANLDVSSIDKIAISGDDRQLIASGLDIIYDSIGDWSYCREFIYQWCLDDGTENIE